MSFNKLQFCFSFYLLLYCQLLPSRIYRSLIHGHNNQRFPNSLTFPWTRVICLTRSNHVVKGVINSQFFMKMTQLKQFEWFPIPINFLQTFSKEMKPPWCETGFPKRFALVRLPWKLLYLQLPKFIPKYLPPGDEKYERSPHSVSMTNAMSM